MLREMMIKKWEIVNMGMKEMQIKEMVSQEGDMVNGLMVGEVMMRGMMIKKWEIVNMGMEEMQIKEMVSQEGYMVNGLVVMQIKEMVSQEGYMVNRLMVGEVMTKMMVGMRWDGREVNMLMRD